MKPKLTWIKLYINDKPTIEILEDASLGKALKKLYKYGESGCTDTTIMDSIEDGNELIAFTLLKKGADESKTNLEERQKNGKLGAETKKKKQIEELSQKNGGDEKEPGEVTDWG